MYTIVLVNVKRFRARCGFYAIENKLLLLLLLLFVSDLMREVSRLLSVRQLQTTPYDVQCNGLVERWKGTLRKMLQKMAA